MRLIENAKFYGGKLIEQLNEKERDLLETDITILLGFSALQSLEKAGKTENDFEYKLAMKGLVDLTKIRLNIISDIIPEIGAMPDMLRVFAVENTIYSFDGLMKTTKDLMEEMDNPLANFEMHLN